MESKYREKIILFVQERGAVKSTLLAKVFIRSNVADIDDRNISENKKVITKIRFYLDVLEYLYSE